MKLCLRVSLANDRGEEFMGAGLVRLLEGVARERSLRSAAGGMGLSYVKALRILRRLEENLGREVVHRTRGGAEHGGAALTAFGRAWLRDVKRLQMDVSKASRRAFRAWRAARGKESSR